MRKVQEQESLCVRTMKTFHSAPQPNCQVNADANTGHAFGIFMACVGALRTFGAPAPLTLGVRPRQ